MSGQKRTSEQEYSMVKGLYTAHMGMITEMRRLDILANNLANADTYGYKKEGTTSRTFADDIAIKIKDTSEANLPRRIGGITFGVHLGQTYTDYSSGSFRITDNEEDLALDGNGFFAISFRDKQGNQSVKYTRDGAFVVDVDGYLVTKDGDHVLNSAGALSGNGAQNNWVRVDPTQSIQINDLGNIYQNDQLVGTVGVVDVDNYDYLEKYGENMYNLVNGGNRIATTARIKQGVLETSNVNVVNEMVNMITIQRAYEAGQKVITSIDGTLDVAANQLGKMG